MWHLHYQTLTLWLTAHPHWGGWIAFAIACSESVAIIGSIIPGSVTMTAIGILLGSGVLPLWVTMIYAIFGAIIGDALSYFLGYHFKRKIHHVWPFTHYPRALIKGQRFVHHHGGKSVIIGRFVGPVRAMVPLIAGMLEMPIKRYFLASIPAAIAWAPTYMLPGILLGAISLEMPKDIATGLILTVLLSLISIWLMIKITYYIYQKTHLYFSHVLDEKWQIWRQQPKKQYFCHLLRHAGRPDKRGQLLLTINTIIAFSIFLLIFVNVLFHGPLYHWNEIVYHLFRGLRTPTLDKMMVYVTFLGDKHMIIPTGIIIFTWFLLRRRWFLANHFLLGMLLSLGGIYTFKQWYFSPRPTGILHQLLSSSFPSGHTTLAMTFYGILAFLISRNVNLEWRKYVYWLAAILIGFVGISRLYLMAHWLTDVMGGILLGLTTLGIVVISYNRYPKKYFSAKNTFLMSLIALSVIYTWHVHYHYKTASENAALHWPTQTLSEHTWWNQHDILTPHYRKNRLGKPIEILNVEWAGNLGQIKTTLQQYGWKNLHTNTYLETLKKIAEQKIGPHKTIIPKLYNDQRPVLEAVKFIDPESPPLILRLWNANTQLQLGRTPLWTGTIYFDTVKKRLFFMHHHTNTAPTILAAQALLPNATRQHWQIKIISQKNFPETLLKEQLVARIILIQ